MRLTYEEFFYYIWNFISENEVSYEYRETNKQFISHLTFALYRRYEKVNVHEMVFAEACRDFFNALFIYQPPTHGFDC